MMIIFLGYYTNYHIIERIITINKKSKTRYFKWISSILVFTLLFTYIPISEFSNVFAEENQNEQADKMLEEKSNIDARKEIVSKRTENSKTFLNTDETYTVEISQKPIHFKNQRNEWQAIDNKLVENTSEQVYENKANDFKVKFDEKHTPDTPFLELEDDLGSIEMQMEPLAHTNEKPSNVEGIVDGKSVKYPDVFPNIDIKYTVGSDRIKEDIIYNEKPTSGFPNQFTYKIDLEGMTVKESEGTIYLYDAKSNKPLYFFDSPYMYDSYKPEGFQSIKEIESIPEEAISYDIQLKHEVIDNQLFLHVIPNKKWLEDSSRIYPITIDPTLVKFQSTSFIEDTNIRSSVPNQTGGNDTELGGGKYVVNVIRGLLKFDVSTIPANATIMSSNVNLWFSSTSNNTPIDISIHKVTKGWEEYQATWNSAKTSSPWSSKGGDFISTPLSTVGGLAGPMDLLTSEMSWDIPTNLVSMWINNPQSNYGLLLKSDTENIDTYKKFISSDHTIGSQYHPLLVVTYKSGARLGLENYWEYGIHPLVGGDIFTNLTTGNNVIQYGDYTLPAKGDFGFDFVRTYNSKSQEKSVFGNGWTATGLENLFIDEDQNTIDYTDEDGTTHTFTFDAASNLYKSGPGKYLTIRKYSTVINGQNQYFYELLNQYGEKTVFKINKIDYSTSMQIARLEYKEDRHGNRITFGYENDRLKKITSQLETDLAKSIYFTYNTAGYVNKASYEGNEFTFSYDSSGRVTQVNQLKNGGNYTSTKFEYVNNRITAIIDPNNRRTDIRYYPEYMLIQEPDIHQVTDAVDRPGTKYSTDIITKMSTVIDPEGNQTTYYTDDNYVVTRFVTGGIETQYDLDANYNVETENTAGSITTNTYDPTNGNLLTTTDPEGNKQIYTYTNYGNIKTYTDSKLKTTTYTYDEKGDLETVEIPDSNADGGKLVTVFDYDDFGDLKSITNPDGSTQYITNDYTSSNKTVENTDAFGYKTKVITDLKGNVLENIDGKSQAHSYTYNSKNELEKVVDPKLQNTEYTYDGNGNISSIKNGRNYVSNFIYNGQNLLMEETNAIGKKTTYDYDSNGNLTNIHLPSSHTITNG